MRTAKSGRWKYQPIKYQVRAMEKKKAYYAHCMLSYGSTIEQEDIKLIKRLGFQVVNPNSQEIKDRFAKFKKQVPEKEREMEFFCRVVSECDLVVFRSLPDGTIPSGVGAELTAAYDENIPVIEIAGMFLIGKRMLDYPQTKQYLTEIGHYKTK